MGLSKPLEDYTIPELKALIKRFDYGGFKQQSLWNWSKQELIIYLTLILNSRGGITIDSLK